MKTLKDITKAKKGQRAVVRVDYNVPLKGSTILDTRRVDASFETIKTLQKKGFQVLLLAHLGDGGGSLKPVAAYLSKFFSVKFIAKPIFTGETKEALFKELEAVSSVETVILFENIRQYPEEEKNTASFAKTLATCGNIFVNDAFSVSHRKHASVVGIAKHLPSYAGAQLQKEVQELSKLFSIKKHSIELFA